MADAGTENLEIEARYWRERCDLYRAKAYSGRLTSQARLRALEHAAAAAEARLKRAQAGGRTPPPSRD